MHLTWLCFLSWKYEQSHSILKKIIHSEMKNFPLEFFSSNIIISLYYKHLIFQILLRAGHHGKKVLLVLILCGPSDLSRSDFGGDFGGSEGDQEQKSVTSGFLCRIDSARSSVLRPGGRAWHLCCHKIRHQKRYFTYFFVLLYIIIKTWLMLFF